MNTLIPADLSLVLTSEMPSLGGSIIPTNPITVKSFVLCMNPSKSPAASLDTSE